MVNEALRETKASNSASALNEQTVIVSISTVPELYGAETFEVVRLGWDVHWGIHENAVLPRGSHS